MTQNKNKNPATIIAVDGPSASGKGSVAQRVATQLGFHYLDSGALYRIVALAASQQNIDWANGLAVAECAKELNIVFENDTILVNAIDVTELIRTEQMGKGASQVAVHPEVRAALFKVQRDFYQAPGLVADGRDMGTVIFPESITKIFLTAKTHIRAERRYQQLLNGKHAQTANYDAILNDLKTRDERDSNRSNAPLVISEDAVVIETDAMTIEETVKKIIKIHQQNTENSFNFQ